MHRPRVLLPLVLEAARTARSQPVASVLTMIMVAVMTSTLLLTFGRSEGAREDVLRTFDSSGSRTITLRAELDVGLTTALLDQLRAIRELEYVAGFGPSQDVQNTLLPGGTGVSMRAYYAPPPNGQRAETAYLSPSAADALRLSDAIGSVETADHLSTPVGGTMDLPSAVAFLDPVVVVPRQPSGHEPLSLIVLVAEDARYVRAVIVVLQSLVSAEDPTQVAIDSEVALADVRGEVANQMSAAARNLILALTALLSGLLSAILYGLVMLRRKDFGRRRALGASKGWITLMVIAQTCLTGAIGAVSGIAVCLTVMKGLGDPSPGAGLVAAVGALTLGLSIAAAVAPAWSAARRDPLVELRVP